MSHQQLFALLELIEQWQHNASQIESGYVLSFDDYLNDMDLRRIIDERLRSLADANVDIPELFSTTLSSADEKFRSATDLVEDNIWGEDTARDEGWNSSEQWYYYRMPKSRPDWL